MGLTERILAFLNLGTAWIATRVPQADKVMHALTGACIFVLVYWLTGSSPCGLGAVVVVGIAKELYDARHRDRHTPDILDAIATWAGAVFVVVLLHVFPGVDEDRSIGALVGAETGKALQIALKVSNDTFVAGGQAAVMLGVSCGLVVNHRLAPMSCPEQRQQDRPRG